MTDSEIIDRIDWAFKQLLSNDKWLLEKDLSERSIAHRWAVYLEQAFISDKFDFQVDCEYNGDAGRKDGLKRIFFLDRWLKANAHLEEVPDTIIRRVFPDIIVHRRCCNDDNLLVIEVKKSTSNQNDVFDRVKMEAYTGRQFGNTLAYQLGLVATVGAKRKTGEWAASYYKDGNEFHPE